MELKTNVQQLRNKFLDKLPEDGSSFHPRDINRAKTDDSWIVRFLTHHSNNVDDALNMLVETCKWRKKNDVNDINENAVNRDYLEEGSLFLHNKDKDGKPLLIFKCSKHVRSQKNFEELKKCVIYWFERAERYENADQVTVFFDMNESGLSNLDMDYTKYLINLCKQYYPNFLNYILIFEMPWVLNTAFKIIKSWLPPSAVQKIKFVTKSSLEEYVEKSQALKSWGGTDTYTFMLVPVDMTADNNNKKKVHFADGSPMIETPPGSFTETSNNNSTSRLLVTPNDAVVFKLEFKELSGSISIKNTSNTPVTYKVKTTSPEKFKVRQSLGMLPVGSDAVIDVVVIPGYTAPNILRDKFLVLNLPLESEQAVISECWKNYDAKKVEQQLLRCKVASLSQTQNGTTTQSLNLDDLSSPTDLEEKIAQLLMSQLNDQEKNENVPNSLSSVEMKISELNNCMNHMTECFCQTKGDIGFLRKIVIFLFFTTLILSILIMTVLYNNYSEKK